jgi:tetratricopeptide (TPR) repeat protein
MDSKPTPASSSPDSLRIQRRRRKLIAFTASGILVALAIGLAFAYVASRPNRADGLVQEGRTLMTPGHYQEAVDRFNRALALDPSRQDVFKDLGLAYQNLGNADEALDNYEKALLVDPRQAEVLTNRATLYRSRGEYQKAIDEFTKALSIGDNADIYFERAVTYELMNDHRKALEDFDRVVEVLRDAPHVLRARALVKQKMGDSAGYQADVAEAERFELRALSAGKAKERRDNPRQR